MPGCVVAVGESGGRAVGGAGMSGAVFAGVGVVHACPRLTLPK